VFSKKTKVDAQTAEPLDPLRASAFQWAWPSPVDFAGELLDLLAYWRRTRRWGTIFAVLPFALFFITAGTLVAIGKLADKNLKMNWYAELANKEIELADERGDDSEADEKTQADGIVKRLPEVADMLFRRVLQLNENNKLAKYYVASQMSRYGSRGSARQIMESLAPTDGSGYAKAHTWLALDLVERSQKGETVNVESLRHHLKRGTSGKDIPPILLLIYSQLLQQENKVAESQEFLKRAAEFDPKLLLNSIVSYRENGLPAQSLSTADLLISKVKGKVEANDEESILISAQAYLQSNRLDNALDILQKSFKRTPQSAKIARALSDAFRFKFRSSAKQNNGQVQVNLEFLNAAIAIDPTNLEIQEELNVLSRLGIGQNDATMDALRVQIATSGTSFVARLLLAESSFRRGDMQSAINDYEVILAELPRMTVALNNLAMLYAQSKPPRNEEALALIDRAVAVSPGEAEFHDSRGDILEALKRSEDAIASYSLALSTAPLRVQTREKLIAALERSGQTELVQEQRIKLEEAKKTVEERLAKLDAIREQQSQSLTPPKPDEPTSSAQDAPSSGNPIPQ